MTSHAFNQRWWFKLWQCI